MTKRMKLKKELNRWRKKFTKTFTLKYTNVDLKISLYVLIHTKIIPWKFHILNFKNSWAVLP